MKKLLFSFVAAAAGLASAEIRTLIGPGVTPGITATTCAKTVPVQSGDALVLPAGQDVFWSVCEPAPGDAVIRLRLAISGLARSAAMIYLGDARFGLEGQCGKMFFGRYPFSQLPRELSDKPGPFKEGKETEIVFARVGTALAISVDGVLLATVKDRRPSLGAIGLRPWRSTMKVTSLTIEADGFKSTQERLAREASERAIAQNFPVEDVSGEKRNQVVMGAGTPQIYHGHPTTTMLGDGKSVLAVWTLGHGGNTGPMALSSDGGLHWVRIDERLPEAVRTHANCPSVYRLIGPDGKARLWIWSQMQLPRGVKTEFGRHDGNVQAFMPSVMSEDEGVTWREMPPLGPKFNCIMTFASIVRLTDGSYQGYYHRARDGAQEILTSVTRDGGFTWSDPRIAARIPSRDLCEPYAFRSPDGQEICCVIRENTRAARSMMMFSRDEGKTWTQPVDTPWALTGDRHQGVQLPDGRLVIVFRDMAPFSPTAGHFLAWVGTYEDLKSGQDRPGTRRIKLLHSYSGSDCGYPGISLLPDGTVLAVTYLRYEENNCRNSVVSVRFRP